MMKKILSLLLALALTLSLAFAFTSCGDGDDGEAAKPTHVEMMFKANDNGTYGKIVIELDYESAPETAENFVNLVEAGFYDGLTIFRSVKNTLIQGGCPNGDGTGNSVTTIPGEFSANGYEGNELLHRRGVISMARPDGEDNYNGASCQFFIVTSDVGGYTFDGYYAAFGKVVEGMEVVDEILDTTYSCGDDTGVFRLDSYKVEIEYARVLENYGE